MWKVLLEYPSTAHVQSTAESYQSGGGPDGGETLVREVFPSLTSPPLRSSFKVNQLSQDVSPSAFSPPFSLWFSQGDMLSSLVDLLG